MSTTITADLARLDRLPRWPWSTGLLVNLGGSFFFAFFDIVVIGAALPVIITDFDVTASAAAWAVTASLLGLIVGEFAGAYLATRKSRVFTLQTALWVFSVGMLLSACAPGLGWLIVARFIAGIGTGADIAVAVTYVSEISPARMRGKITGFTTVCGYVGIAIVPILAAIVLPAFTWGWRGLFVFGALGAVLLVLTRRHMPSSPRLLAQRGEDRELSALIDQAEARVRGKIGELPPLAEPAPAESLQGSQRPPSWGPAPSGHGQTTAAAAGWGGCAGAALELAALGLAPPLELAALTLAASPFSASSFAAFSLACFFILAATSGLA